MNSAVVRILFVCCGNICRSPTAEAIMRSMVDDRGLADRIEVDSAGTGDWHVGERSDARSREAGARRGYLLDGRARQVEPSDYERFDHILVVDESNLAIVRRHAPPGSRAQIALLDRIEVPDPYYGGPNGFEKVLDQLEAACARLLDRLDVRAAPA